MGLIKKVETPDLKKPVRRNTNEKVKKTEMSDSIIVGKSPIGSSDACKFEESSESFDPTKYLFGKAVSEVNLLVSSNMCRQILLNFNEQNAFVLIQAIKNLELKEERSFLHALLNHIDGMTYKKIEELYSRFNEQSLKIIIPYELVSELNDIIVTAKAAQRGFTVVGNNKNKITFNANEFVAHFMGRCYIVTTKEGELYFYNKKGYYDKLPAVSVGKIIREVMHEGIPNSWKSNYEKEVIKAIQREAKIVDKMNPFHNHINVRNGMLNLNDFQLNEHSPEYYSVVQIPVCYDPYAVAPKFNKYMNDITLGDRSLMKVHQEVMGYVLSAETKAEKAFFFHGSGANGKSVLVSVMTQLVGKENISSIPLSSFGQPFGLEGLINKSVNIAAENEMSGMALKTENFKAIVSGDTVSINIKYRTAITYKPHCKLIFVVNTLPNTIDVTNGYFRKILIIPFKRTFKPEDRNVNLVEELLGELPGILNWSIEGLKRLRANSYQFSESHIIEECHRNYYAEQNPVMSFVSEHLIQREGVRTKRTDFYDEYVKWLNLQGIDDKGTKSRQTFWKYFKIVLGNEDIPIVEKKVNGISYFDGISTKGIDQRSSLF